MINEVIPNSIYNIFIFLSFDLVPILLTVELLQKLKLRKKYRSLEQRIELNNVIMKVNSNKFPGFSDISAIVALILSVFYSNRVFVKNSFIILIILIVMFNILDITQNFYIIRDGIICRYGHIYWDNIKLFDIREGEVTFYREFTLTLKYDDGKEKNIEKTMIIREKKEKIDEIKGVLQREIYNKKG
ncbi:hypothetical protein [Dethiothermospora halolimnae]|uniref:hypothetical protein n=1 Tax=Dethiothermospora halolimnae TaxID=3114390 RepID=UPI003CCC250F